jgi:flagellar biosynthesis/type III secretory pathway chaperone
LSEVIASNTDIEASLAKAMLRVAELEALLEEEFESLKQQNLSNFDTLNEKKNKLLKELMALTGIHKPEDAQKLDARWNEFKDKMRLCRNLHRRSEILVSRKLDAIKGAIDSIRSVSGSSSVETYDKLGRVRRGRQITGYMTT